MVVAVSTLVRGGRYGLRVWSYTSEVVMLFPGMQTVTITMAVSDIVGSNASAGEEGAGAVVW